MIIRLMGQRDVALIDGCARMVDREEMLAGAGQSIADALQYGIDQSLRAWVIEAHGRPLAAVGDTMHGIGTGVPWMVTTDHVVRDARAFLRGSRAVLMEMLQRHQLLVNYVDARNVNAIRWLAWLGFTIGNAVPYGVQGLPFHKFHMIRS